MAVPGYTGVRFVVFVLIVAAGCSSVAGSEPVEFAEPLPIREPVELTMTLYLVSDAGDPSSPLSTSRTVDEVAAIAENLAAIWAQADVGFGEVQIREVEMPSEVLGPIVQGRDTNNFFDQVGRTFDLPNPGTINGFYVRDAGGVNGFAPLNSRVFFVVDTPTVHDERVSSHEIGHILGLHHALIDPGRLMFSGTNGIDLTVEEQAVARYSAQGILDALR